MSHDFLADRRKALEEAFFAKQDAKLIEQLRAEREKRLAMAALKSASNIEDDELLAKLVDLGIDARSWTALALVPLIEVAWADGRLDPKERKAVLAAASEHGVEPGSPGYALLESLLTTRPDKTVFAAWGSYVTALVENLRTEDREAMRARLVQRARKIAKSKGGLLGIGSISDAEKHVLAALERPFA